jgi:alkaline phosphatase D
MNTMNRRSFLAGCVIASATITVSTALTGCTGDQKKSAPSDVLFSHGVASGDPLANAVIIWTRALPSTNTMQGKAFATVNVLWEIATDQGFVDIVRVGQVSTSESVDYTIKVDVQDLQAATQYYFRFTGADQISRVGRTKTLPVGDVDSIKLAVLSCSNFPAGYFNAYAEAAKDDQIDAVLHLGDYIYEYAMGGYATQRAEEIGRSISSDNDKETISLADYRKRYALYRTDKGLLDLHANTPFIAVWDDHEVANDTYKYGAQNHNKGEGDFFERRLAAISAYYEWLPIRPPKGNQSPEIYRYFEFGNLLSLYMLDTRIIGRDKQLDYSEYRDTETNTFNSKKFIHDINKPQRTLLGKKQFDWLNAAIFQSTSKWQVLGQQVLMSKMMLPTEVFGGDDRSQIPRTIEQLVNIQQAVENGQEVSEQELNRLNTKMPYNLDAWDGYPAEREKLYATAQQSNKSLIVLAGDTHNAWHSVLSAQNGLPVGVEFATPAVSSPGMEYYLRTGHETSSKLAQQLPLLIDDLQYCNLHQRGYMTLTLTSQKVTAEWIYIDQILSPNYQVVARHKVDYG